MIPPATLAYLSSPVLRPLWAAAHSRLARNGRTARGRLTLTSLDPPQREALGHLLDRIVTATHTVDLSQLDERLRTTAAGTGLLDVVEAVVGPVPDRRALASASRSQRAALRDHATAALTTAGLSGHAWAHEWMDQLWRQGLPARLPADDVHRVIEQAVATLARTVGEQARTWSRGELAQAVTGSAHGLDDDTTLARLVLRGLALALTGSPTLPTGAAERRALWDAAGVAGDTIATTVLACGLRPHGIAWLQERADIGAESHLTLREIRRLAPWSMPPQTVYVCENPRVLEAALDNGVRAPIVCTMGNPTTVTLALLDAITAAGHVTLAYHGDFDWPGIAIAARIMRRYPAAPWQFTAVHYREAVAQATRRGTPRQPLTGSPVQSPWDPALVVAMAEQNVAIHEEALIETLLADL
ncbi:TIGR02679 family protein [Actinoplanes utahensis]|uniref:TIGR02679 family protein n=1 Tax=Actinoplanes utahensis TaxID=1869 RepID=A0A0A6X9P2_ACTUT|nr:TIGR02679 family protein [Actinoplanes utahensis]KHD76792.1 hypothetical protein MB27_14650 [Actinoplanes utahensis]GIF33349.1 hypothetical protein Aut01nite_63350 [Actinoplanes utahensis]